MGNAPGISAEAVRARTGKDWAEWFRLLDQAGAKEMPHKRIALLLEERSGAGPWWRQMIAVEYERARGLREVHQSARGFVAGVSRTIGAPVTAPYAAWIDAGKRRKWLGDEAITVRAARENKSLRITWSDGATDVQVSFYSKGEAKCQIVVEHSKLKSNAAVTRAKAHWSAALDRLTALLTAPRLSPTRDAGRVRSAARPKSRA